MKKKVDACSDLLLLLDRCNKRGADTPHCLSVSGTGVKYLDPQVTAGRCCKTCQTYKYS